MPTLAELEARGQIEAVAPDSAVSQDELAMARRHLATARGIADSDPVVAYTALYDATRKAISAHMRNSGYKATPGLGQHAKTMAYARAALAGRGGRKRRRSPGANPGLLENRPTGFWLRGRAADRSAAFSSAAGKQ